ncbi:exonuclease SbcCD subunit D [Dermabacteraceae bacterium TAE3-ERU5]|nr:exonuclease SbcCD subunit D [Dermabacteraceae bacterium TAE3-ERU5]
MLILHTSDWHLGRTLHGVDLSEYQRAFQEFLLHLVRERKVDAVVIPGDVYDRAVPPLDAVRLLNETLAALAKETTVILTPGNHDSATRLGFGRELMRSGIHLLTDTAGIAHPVEMADEHGPVLFFGLPYLEPDMARYELAGEDGELLARSHEAVTRAAMARVRGRLEEYSLTHGIQPRAVVLAHTFVTGGSGCDSERDLRVGGVDSVGAAAFHGVDYVALGHLHGQQCVPAQDGPGKNPLLYYSGSPLAYSFSEKNHRKGVLLVELGAPGADGTRARIEVEKVAAPVPRRLSEVRGSLEEILALAETYGDDWLHAVVTDPQRPAQMQERLRAAFPHLLLLEYRPQGGEHRHGVKRVSSARDPREVMDEFYRYFLGADPDEKAREVLAAAYERARGEECSA